MITFLCSTAATTCAEAGKQPGCCTTGLFSQSCFVPGGRCYCDSQCVVFNDCCDDVPQVCGECTWYSAIMLSYILLDD